MLERIGFDLAVPRPSAVPAIERRGATDDRSGGSEGPGPAAIPPALAALLDGRARTVSRSGSPAPASHARRRLPEARAPPA